MRIKRFIKVGVLALLLGFPASGLAEDLNVEFTYPGKSEGFTLYMNGDVYCKITEAESTGEETFNMVCDPKEIPYGWNEFTLTADIPEETWSTAHESRHSLPVKYFKEHPDEYAPSVLTITIRKSDGTEVILRNVQ